MNTDFKSEIFLTPCQIQKTPGPRHWSRSDCAAAVARG